MPIDRPVRLPPGLAAAFLIALAGAAPRLACGDDSAGDGAAVRARGIVFEDRDADGIRDPDEPGLAGILVSNQVEVVRTGADGSYALPCGDDTTIFVIQPRGFRVPVDARSVPRFAYAHKPAGSPRLRFPGVAPTGPLPAAIDFPLVRAATDDERFRVVVFGDTQPRDRRELGYIARDVVEPLIGVEAAFGVTLGDLCFDDLALLDPLAEMVGRIGVPWYHVIGNHDLNFDAPSHDLADETYERVFGPPCFAWQVGRAWFVALNTVRWHPKQGRNAGRYTAGIDDRQMRFLKALLAEVPKDDLVVLLMHIPLVGCDNRAEVYRLIEERPHTLSLSAHQHYHEHVFVGANEGWRGKEPHHHIIHGTVCGDWWHGAPDEAGIPHATMRDGTPNGHSILTIDGTGYRFEYRAARRPAEEQMHVDLPASVQQDDADKRWVYVNVYDGSERSRVEMRVAPNGAWIPLERAIAFDPAYTRVRKREEASPPGDPYRVISAPVHSSHLWRARVPEAPPGLHLLEVRAIDLYGQEHRGRRLFRVTSAE